MLITEKATLEGSSVETTGFTNAMQPASTCVGLLAEAVDSVDMLEESIEWQLAQRVAQSKALAKSDLMRRFLLYVCEQHLIGNSQGITEVRIGTKVFNRSVGYDPGEDNIVRNYARLLRKRLDQYFKEEGRLEPIQIAIPRGGYVPLFHPAPDLPERDTGLEESESATPWKTETSASTVAVGLSGMKQWWWFLAGLFSGAAIVSCVWFYVLSMHANQKLSLVHLASMRPVLSC
jgi:hypothetical protein